jgi:hypothetical protein
MGIYILFILSEISTLSEIGNSPDRTAAMPAADFALHRAGSAALDVNSGGNENRHFRSACNSLDLLVPTRRFELLTYRV